MTPALLLITIALVLFGFFALAFVGVVWYVFRRPLSRSKGEVELPGLSGSVEIVRDRWGVPHIYAATERDAFFAQGYVHAQDRLFQMEYARRLARGTLAEGFGVAALEADRWSRVIGFWRAAQQDWQALGPEETASLEAYAAGVNAFVASNLLRLPAEFTIAGFRPEPWQTQDTLGVLKVLGWALSQNWEGELLRLELLHALGPERAAELEPFYPASNPIAVSNLGGTVSPEQLAEAAGRVRAAYQAASGWFGQATMAGSNNWVIGPQRTASRRPLLANDPHLSVSMPTLWYENHVEAADGSLRFAGATMPGIPGIVVGHNERIGWGITAGRADTQDLYVEQHHPEHPTWFRIGDEWTPATVLHEEIQVRGQAKPHLEEVIVTRHGPLINGLVAAQSSEIGASQALPDLALRWSGHEPSASMRGLLHLLKARDWSTFRAALADVGDPSLNIVYADVDGNIGYQYVARVPKRRQGHGLVPSPGWDDSHAWDGWVPFDELPSALNPSQGYALSANNKPAPDSYPHFLGADWYPGYRAARIDRMLQAKPRFTINDFQNMQMDVFSVQAEALVPLLTLAEGSNQLEKRIVRELETWNLRIEVDSFPAAAYEVMRLHLLDLVFGDKLGSLAGAYKGKSLNAIFSASTFAGKASLCLVNLLEQDESWWFRDAATGATRTRDELLRVALKRTADTLYDLIGKDPRKWAWGKVHQIEFPHLFGRNRFMRTMFNRGQYPISGDEQTVWMTAQNLELPFGLVTTTATYRQVLDVGDWDRSTAILSTGQSGQPTSEHYADHFELWRDGEQHAMLWSRQAVDAEAEATLWLRRAEGGG